MRHEARGMRHDVNYCSLLRYTDKRDSYYGANAELPLKWAKIHTPAFSQHRPTPVSAPEPLSASVTSRLGMALIEPKEFWTSNQQAKRRKASTAAGPKSHPIYMPSVATPYYGDCENSYTTPKH